MAKFICPKCRAENIVEEGYRGCALCGYGQPQKLPEGNTSKCEQCHKPHGKCGGHVLCG